MFSDPSGVSRRPIPQPTPFPVAPFGRRFAALLLDFAALTAFIALTYLLDDLLGLRENWPTAASAALSWAELLLFVALYSPLTTSRWGGTPGKLVCRLRVVAVRDGSRLGYGRALLRHLSHVVMWGLPPGGLADLLVCLFDRPLRQSLHDKIARSVVVRRL